MSLYKLNRQILSSLSIQPNNISNGEPDSYDGGEYLFDISYTNDGAKFISSSSDMQIRSYDSNTFQVVNSIVAHESRISSMETSRYDPNIVLTASEDKMGKGWDLRSQSEIFNFNMSEEVYSISLGVGGQLIALGSGISVSFFDMRKSMTHATSACLGEYSDIHTDLISSVQFNPFRDNILASASEDGLICTFDVSVSSGEEAVLSILNTETPVRKFGFFGHESVAMYSLSTVETLSIWHHPSAQRIGHFPAAREMYGVDYLVDCLYDQHIDSLMLATGMYDGRGKLFLVQPEVLTPMTNLDGGHHATIRCMAANHAYSSGIISGGEDSRICHWTPAPQDGSKISTKHDASGSGRKMHGGASTSRGSADAKHSKSILDKPY